jgi:hypothetical protein
MPYAWRSLLAYWRWAVVDHIVEFVRVVQMVVPDLVAYADLDFSLSQWTREKVSDPCYQS